MDHLLTRALLCFLFFLSGSTSLVYQLLWTRRLTLILGHSVLAVSSVVSITMAGLALGAWAAGRASTGVPRIQVQRYAGLEAFIGLWALLSFSLLQGTSTLYLTAAGAGWSGTPLYLIGLAGAALVLLPPTAAMGATLPLLCVALVRQEVLPGHLLSELYGVNTLGAFTGAALTGFALLPLFGTWTSLVGAALINFGLALMGSVLSKSFREQARQTESYSPGTVPRGALLAFGLVGVASMVLQVGWTRGLILTLGSSTYAFAAVLSIFLLGIALGSILFALLPAAWVARLTASGVGALILLGGIAAGLSTVLLGYLPLVFILLFSWTGGEFSRVLSLQLLMVLSVIGPTCLIMGLVFPAINQVFGRSDPSLGGQVGRLYAVNTVGCIVGALLAGFFLIPWVGVQHTLQSAVMLQLLACLVFFGWRGKLAGSLVAALCLLAPTWSPGLMSAGSGIYGQGRIEVSLSELKQELWLPPAYYRDGFSTTVSVHVSGPGSMTVKVNGKVDASLNQTDRQTMYFAGYLGGLFVEQPARAAVIGLGSGMTLEALSHFPQLQSIECAELEPAMLEANRFWYGYNGQVLDDPRVQVRLTDGRTLLQSASEPYDLIISEPSNPWIAGVGDLFTQDFFAICRDRLSEQGVMIQWFHFYGVSDREVGMVFNSFFQAFPEGSVWLSAPGDLLMVGSKKPLKPSTARFRKLYDSSPELQKRLYETGILYPDSLAGLELFDRRRALEFRPEAPLNTDDRPLLEFAAPRHLFQDDLVAGNLRLLMSHAGGPDGREPATVAHAWLNFWGEEWVRRWLGQNSGTPEGKFVKARFLAERNFGEETQRAFEQALSSASNPGLVAALWAEFEFKSGRMQNAALLLDRALESNPKWSLAPILRTRWGQALSALDKHDEAVVQLQKAAEHSLANDAILTSLAVALTKTGEVERARQTLDQSLQYNPYSLDALLGAGYLAMVEKRWEDGLGFYDRAALLMPGNDEALVNKGMCLAKLGRRDEAFECFQEVLRFHPDHQVASHNLRELRKTQ